MEKKTSGFGIAALVLGIIAILGCFIPFLNFISFFLAFLAIVFAIIAICKKSSLGMPIAALIISVLAFGIGIAVNGATTFLINETSKELDKQEEKWDKTIGNSTEDVLKEDVEVTLGDLSITTDEYGFTDSEMIVTLKNITKEKKSYDIHIEAVDASGNRIDDAYVMVSDLGPGQSTTEKIFRYIEDDKVEAMKTATFKIIEASAY